MAIKTLIKNKTDDLGKSEEICCPVCEKAVQMQLFSNYDLDNYFAKILKSDEELNFCVCPECASVFTINMSSYGVQNSPLRPYHLTVLRNGKNG